MPLKDSVQRDNKVAAKRRSAQAMTLKRKSLTQQFVVQQAKAVPLSLTQSDVLQLQRTVNNQTISRLLTENTQSQLTHAPAAIIQRVSDTGLAGKKRVKSYITAASKSVGKWGSFKSGDAGLYQKIDALLVPANKQLAKAEVPKVTGVIDPLDIDPSKRMAGSGDRAAFMRATWQVSFNPDILKGGLTHEEFERLANTVYHECRHAEQTFRVARKLAAESVTAGDIAQRLGINIEIAKEAVKRPLSAKKKIEWEEAVSWQSSIDKASYPDGGGKSLSEVVNADYKQAQKDYSEALQRVTTAKQLLKLLKDPNDPSVSQPLKEGFAQHYSSPESRQKLPETVRNIQIDFNEKRKTAKERFLQYTGMSVEADAWEVGGLVSPHSPEDELKNLAPEEVPITL